MKYILLLLITIGLFSCTTITGDTVYSIETIDECEYIKKYQGYNRGYSFSHKGNCKNPIHKY